MKHGGWMKEQIMNKPGIGINELQTRTFAVNLCANSSWNMITAQRNMGLWAKSLNRKGEEIWYGRFATQTSK